MHDLYNDSARTDCLFVEVFSGSCRLSKACHSLDFRCTAIDKDPGRSENFPVYICDITNEEQFLNLRTYLEKERSAILHAHFAPSCGTASRARERPIPGFKTAPKPLRSDAHPDGLPNLSESEHQRVSEANRSYAAMSQLIFVLVELGVSISIENPRNSLLWKTSFLKHLLGKLPTYHVCTFHHCMHGGKRDKDTAWYSFNPRDPQRDLFASLALKCNKQHQHAPWKPYVDASGKRIFPTADEAAYPHLLCERVAYILRTEAKKAGFIFPTDLHQQLDHTNVSAKRQLFTTQPRGRRLRPLVSEFSGYVTVVTLPDRSEFLEQTLRTLPKGARICHRVLQQWGWNRDDMAQKSRTVVVDERCGTDGQCEVVNIGIPREPSEFIQEALNKGHPRDIIANIRDAERDLLLNLVHQPCSVRFQKRAAFMKKWLKRSLELKESEQKLHDSLAPHLVPILMGKRLLLWKEILIDLAYSDVAVIDDVVKGFALTGWAPQTGVFHKHVRKPSLTTQELRKRAAGLNAAVTGSLENSTEGPHDQYAWDETMEEVQKGWLGVSDGSSECVIAKRFPLVQGSKVRLIDDFSICGANSAYGMTEKLRVQSIDELTAYLAYILDSTEGAACPALVGRTFDLKHAYKQFGVDEWHSKFLNIAVRKPGGSYGLFKVYALPFGASGSVTSFLRVACSIAYIGTYGLDITWTSFFDDFTVLCTQEEADNVGWYVESLFKLLGVEYAATGDKAPPFQSAFKSLGLIIDVSTVNSGTFSIQHTSKRRDELLNSLRSILKAATAAPKELERLHGRLVWFSSFIFGRLMNGFVRTLSEFSRVRTSRVLVQGSLAEALQGLEKLVEQSQPVRVSRALCWTWLVFTDGAYEKSDQGFGSVGGVLVSPQGILIEIFGERVNAEFLEILLGTSKHPIYELEILPVLMAASLWATYIAGGQVVFYIDNEAARSAFIQGVGATVHTKSMVQNFVRLEERIKIYSWFGRVPSHSNIADQPSRLQFTNPLFDTAKRIRVVDFAHFLEAGCDRVCSENQGSLSGNIHYP